MIAPLIAAASRVAGCPQAVILGDQRRADICRARHAAQWLACQQGNSLMKIGRVFHRDHASIIHARRRVDAVTAPAERAALLQVSPDVAIGWIAERLAM